jgi:malonyl CoA-acyl carrier protein transacylase
MQDTPRPCLAFAGVGAPLPDTYDLECFGGASRELVAAAAARARASEARAPLRGALVLGAASEADLVDRLGDVLRDAAAGRAPAPAAPLARDLAAPERLAIDYGDAAELAAKAARALRALALAGGDAWRPLAGQGVFRGRGPRARVAFLHTGLGSQYVNMLRGLREREPIVAATFDEADRVMDPLLGRSLSEQLFPHASPEALARAEAALGEPAVAQPAVLAVDAALARLLEAYGVRPDCVMGHSLGEYGALVTAGVLSFEHALFAVSARGRELERVSVPDHGRMAAVLGPVEEVESVLAELGGEVVVANHNSRSQAVIGGGSAAVEAACRALAARGRHVVPLRVSHAYHTSIVAPARAPLRRTLEALDVREPRVPVVANVDGSLYPTGAGARERILDLLERQVASPVLFVRGLRTLFEAGVRVFVEVGPKRALHGCVEDVFAGEEGVLSLYCNHPKLPDDVAFNHALCGLYASGLGRPRADAAARPARVAPAQTGLRLGRGRRVVVKCDEGLVCLALAARLEPLGVDVLPIEGVPAAEELEQAVRGWLAQGPIDGVYWLPALDEPLPVWPKKDALAPGTGLLGQLMRLLDHQRRPLRFLVTGERVAAAGARGEGLAPRVGDFVGSYGRERPETLAMVVECGRDMPAAACAERLIAETLRGARRAEVADPGQLRLEPVLA